MLNKIVNIRMTDELYGNLKHRADKEGRSLSNLIVFLLKKRQYEGEWLRMSDLSEEEDDRYQCSHCGNVVHHNNRVNLFTYNSWCGKCGSLNNEFVENYTFLR